jgi:hypothetical protein
LVIILVSGIQFDFVIRSDVKTGSWHLCVLVDGQVLVFVRVLDLQWSASMASEEADKIGIWDDMIEPHFSVLIFL